MPKNAICLRQGLEPDQKWAFLSFWSLWRWSALAECPDFGHTAVFLGAWSVLPQNSAWNPLASTFTPIADTPRFEPLLHIWWKCFVPLSRWYLWSPPQKGYLWSLPPTLKTNHVPHSKPVSCWPRSTQRGQNQISLFPPSLTRPCGFIGHAMNRACKHQRAKIGALLKLLWCYRTIVYSVVRHPPKENTKHKGKKDFFLRKMHTSKFGLWVSGPRVNAAGQRRDMDDSWTHTGVCSMADHLCASYVCLIVSQFTLIRDVHLRNEIMKKWNKEQKRMWHQLVGWLQTSSIEFWGVHTHKHAMIPGALQIRFFAHQLFPLSTKQTQLNCALQTSPNSTKQHLSKQHTPLT